MPSPDGRFVAYNLATGGSELATIVVVEVARGVTLGPGVGRTWGDAPVTWLPDSSGFAYVELAEPRPGRDPDALPAARNVVPRASRHRGQMVALRYNCKV